MTDYRYTLTRRWGTDPSLFMCMLNPSTADETIDDPTIRRCIGLAKREKCGGLFVVNLFALRATKPAHLGLVDDPVGPGNYNALLDTFKACDRLGVPIVCAWGSNPFAAERAEAFKEMARAYQVPLLCLGRTKQGAPRHPLYLKTGTPLEPYE